MPHKTSTHHLAASPPARSARNTPSDSEETFVTRRIASMPNTFSHLAPSVFVDTPGECTIKGRNGYFHLHQARVLSLSKVHPADTLRIEMHSRRFGDTPPSVIEGPAEAVLELLELLSEAAAEVLSQESAAIPVALLEPSVALSTPMRPAPVAPRPDPHLRQETRYREPD